MSNILVTKYSINISNNINNIYIRYTYVNKTCYIKGLFKVNKNSDIKGLSLYIKKTYTYVTSIYTLIITIIK